MNAKQRRIKKLIEAYDRALLETQPQFGRAHSDHLLTGCATWKPTQALVESRQAADQAYFDLHAALNKEGINLPGPGCTLNWAQLMRYLASN